jgi:large subunit ribosomal protein L10
MITKDKKKELVKKLKELYNSSSGIVITEYRALSMEEITSLREELKKLGDTFKVVKNTLMKRAIEENKAEGTDRLFVGPIAVAFSKEDIGQTAKAILEFRKKVEKVDLKGALVDGRLYEREEIEQIAKLPSKDVLLGQLAGTMVAPLSNFASVLAASIRDFVNVLNNLKDKKES